MTYDVWSPPRHGKIDPRWAGGTWRGFRIARFPVWPATRQLILDHVERLGPTLAAGCNPERIAASLKIEGHMIPEDTVAAVLIDLDRRSATG